MYQTMKIESLLRMIPFFDFSAVEKISVDAVKQNFIAMKVDHSRNIVLFGDLVLNFFSCFLSFFLLFSFYTKVQGH